MQSPISSGHAVGISVTMRSRSDGYRGGRFIFYFKI